VTLYQAISATGLFLEPGSWKLTPARGRRPRIPSTLTYNVKEQSPYPREPGL